MKEKIKIKTKLEEIYDETVWLDLQINAKLEEITYWRDLASKTEAVLGTVGGRNKSRNKSKVENCVCKIIEIEESVKEDTEKIIKLKSKIMEMIEKAGTSEYMSLLIHRYICGKTWEEVAAAIGYSYVHTVNRLRPKALAKLHEIETGTGTGDKK